MSQPSSPDTVLDALGDRTRRTVLRLIAEDGPATATELAAPLGISRQAVSKHLSVLADAGVVESERIGREARYRLVPEGLDAASRWMDTLALVWDDRATRLRRHLDRAVDPTA